MRDRDNCTNIHGRDISRVCGAETSLLVIKSTQNSGLKLELFSSVHAVYQREQRSERKSPEQCCQVIWATMIEQTPHDLPKTAEYTAESHQ